MEDRNGAEEKEGYIERRRKENEWESRANKCGDVTAEM